MSLGNIIFSGAYLFNERDFNKATKTYPKSLACMQTY